MGDVVAVGDVVQQIVDAARATSIRQGCDCGDALQIRPCLAHGPIPVAHVVHLPACPVLVALKRQAVRGLN